MSHQPQATDYDKQRIDIQEEMKLGNYSQLCQKLDAILLDVLHGNISCEYMGFGTELARLSLLSEDGMVNITFDESYKCKIKQIELTSKGEAFILDGGYCNFERPPRESDSTTSLLRRLQDKIWQKLRKSKRP